MKTTNSFLFLFCLFIAPSLSAQSEINVPEKQVPLVSKISASWCPYCGEWGWDFMESLLADNQETANLITVHYSGDYRSQAGAEMTSNFGAFGQPQFFLNSDLISVNASTVGAQRSEVKNAITMENVRQPIAQTGLLAGTYEGQFNVIAKTRFFQEAEGEYYLGLYVVEKSFNGPQAGRGSNALHKNVLRMALTEGTFGVLMAEGALAQGTEVLSQRSISISDLRYELDKIFILSVIWKKEGNKYQVINTNSVSQFQDGVTLLPTARQRLAKADFELFVQPNVVSDFSLLRIILPSQRQNFRISLWTPNGQKLRDIFQGVLPAGEHQWQLERKGEEAAGWYLLRLDDGAGQITRRIIFN